MDKKNSEVSNGIRMSEEVEKLKAKMTPRFGDIELPVQNTEELPSMEATEKNTEDADKLREKANSGAVNVVKNVMKQPEVQTILKKNINKQTFVSGLFMAFLLIGFLEVSQAIKQLFNYTWQFDLVAGIVMISVGAVYMIKNVVLTSEPQKIK